MFSCQSIQNIFVEIMKLKFGQDFEVEILFKLEFKKLGKMTQASCCWAGEPVKNYLAVFFSLRGVVVGVSIRLMYQQSQVPTSITL